MIQVSILNVSAMTKADYENIILKLSPYRRERAQRYKIEQDRYLSAGAGYLLDCALKERGRRERDAEYTFNEHAKPYMGGLQFNLSHSGTLVALAVGEEEVGVDIEKITPVKEELIRRVCTERELAYLNEAPQDRASAFFRLWTAKESAGKYLGIGLTDPKAFEVDLSLKSVTYKGERLNATLKEYQLEGYALTACGQEPFSNELITVTI